MRRTRWLLALVVFSLAAVGWQWQAARARGLADRWLAEAHTAPRLVDYQGTQLTVLHVDGQRIASRVKVWHRAPDMTRREYLGPGLAGTVVVTHGGQMWRLDPRVGHTVATAAAPADLPQTTAGYRLRVRDGGLVANRPTRLLTLTGPTLQRLFWLDRETGLPLRHRTLMGGQVIADTVFEQFARGVGQEASFAPPAGETAHTNELVSLAASSKRVGFQVRRPGYVPSGYRLVGSYLYDCPCGCPMEAAQLVYSNGLGWISLFQQHSRHRGCGLTDECCHKGAASGRCVAARDGATNVVARVDRHPVVVVLGDVPQRELAKMADSVPAQPLGTAQPANSK